MIKNNFEIRHAGKTIRRQNSINNVFDFYRKYQKLCGFLFVKCDGNEYFFRQPQMSSSNFDTQKGRLFVTYEAGLAASELGGRTILAVGFSASESPLDIVNSSQVNIEKIQGEPMHICGTLQLSVSTAAGGGQAALLPCDNRLVKMLLGAEHFDSAPFRLTYGTDNMPMEAYVYTGKNPSVYCPPTINAQQISFLGNFAAPATDAVLLCDGVPVLRFMPQLATKSVDELYLATENDSLTFDANDRVVAVDKVKINSATDMQYTITRVPYSISFLCAARFVLPKGAEIRTDTSRNHFAFVSGDRVAFLSLDGGEANVTKWLVARDALPCEDGTVFTVDTLGKVSIFRQGTETKLDILAGEKYAAVKSGDKYIFATWRAGKLWVFTIDQSLAFTSKSYASSAEAGGVHIFALPDMICSVSDTQAAVAVTAEGEDSLHIYWLNTIRNASWFLGGTQLWFEGGRLIVYESYYDQTHYYQQIAMKSVICPSYGRVFGEFVVRNKWDSADIISAYTSGTMFGTVDCPVSFAATVGRLLYLFLADGRVLSYYINSKKMRIFSGRITAGFSVGFTVHSVVPVSQMTIKIKRR